MTSTTQGADRAAVAAAGLAAAGGRSWALHRPVLERLCELSSASTFFNADAAALEMEARRGAGPENVRGVSVVKLHGILTPRLSLFALLFGGGGLFTFLDDLSQAIGDPDTSAVVVDVDSPGGVVDMIPETAAQVRAMRDEARKPIVAVVNTLAASGAYWIASQAHEMICTPSGQAGSVGVYTLHWDESEAVAMEGLKPTFISAGEQKVAGNPFEPLDPDTARAMQETVDDLYSMFVADVAKGRGVEKPATDGGQAFGAGRVYLAERARKMGLVDRVATLSDTIRRLTSGRAKVKQFEPAAALEFLIPLAGPIPAHSTATSDDAWDGPANEANLSNDAGAATYRKAYAWVDSDGDPDVKASYKFIHHFVSSDGAVGAASTKACSTGIGVLNGARGGTTIPAGDRAGVHAHLKRHLTDAGQDAPDLASAEAAVIPPGLAELERLAAAS